MYGMLKRFMLLIKPDLGVVYWEDGEYFSLASTTTNVSTEATGSLSLLSSTPPRISVYHTRRSRPLLLYDHNKDPWFRRKDMRSTHELHVSIQPPTSPSNSAHTLNPLTYNDIDIQKNVRNEINIRGSCEPTW
ncbi:hypothetical protein PM082_000666 [Marasmius tenuissimus]|nr:hypothetical protein PM082_000666 [Marasmius tenuissimus]